MHFCFYWTYLLTLPLSLYTSALRHCVLPFFSPFCFMHSWQPGFSSVMQIILMPQVFFHLFLHCCPFLFSPLSYSFLLAPGIHISLYYSSSIPSSRSPCGLSYSLCHSREVSHLSSSLSSFFIFFSCSANKSVNDLSVNMPNWEDE